MMPSNILALWGPSRLHKELRFFCIPELVDQLNLNSTSSKLIPNLRIIYEGDDALLTRSDRVDEDAYIEAAGHCTLLTALLRVLADRAPDLQNLADAVSELDINITRGSIRTAVLQPVKVSTFTRRQFQEECEDVFINKKRRQQPMEQTTELAKNSKTTEDIYWCLHIEDSNGRISYTLGMQLAVGKRPGTQGEAVGPSFQGRAPTTMLPELAALSANLAGIQPGSIVADPCCGSGSLLLAALNAAQGTAAVIGSDVALPPTRSGTGILKKKLPFDRMSADATKIRFRPCCLDAIICDPPYGVRAAVVSTKRHNVGSYSNNNNASSSSEGASCTNTKTTWQYILTGLLSLAENALVPGGRILCWIPHNDTIQTWIEELSKDYEQLSILYYLPERRDSGLLRAVVVWQKIGQRKVFQHLRRASNAVSTQEKKENRSKEEEGGIEVRHLAYKEARTVLQGANADIWRAAWLGDVAAITDYLASGGDPDQQDKKKRQTPLQFAAGYGRLAAVKCLLEGGANVSIADDKSKMAPLHRAAARGHAGVVHELLQYKAIDPLQTSSIGQTALHYAAQFGHMEALKELLDFLILEKNQLFIKQALTAPDENGYTPLHLAAQWGKAEAVESLLSCVSASGTFNISPDIVSLGDESVTPAHLAARWDHVDVLKVLAAHSADFGVRSGVSKDGATPLEEAIMWHREACVAYLQQ